MFAIGTQVFIPKQGVRKITAMNTLTIYGATLDRYELTKHDGTAEHLSKKTVDAVARTLTNTEHVRQTLHDLATAKYRSMRWNSTAADTFDALLQHGALENNLKVLSLIHDINQGKWSVTRWKVYNTALTCCSEEIAAVLGSTLREASNNLTRTLNNLCFATRTQQYTMT